MNECDHPYDCDKEGTESVLMPSFFFGFRKEMFCEAHAKVAQEMKERLLK